MSWRYMAARTTITRCPELIEDWTMVEVYDDGAAWSGVDIAAAGSTRKELREVLRMMLQAAEGEPFFDLDTHKVVTPGGLEVAP